MCGIVDTGEVGQQILVCANTLKSWRWKQWSLYHFFLDCRADLQNFQAVPAGCQDQLARYPQAGSIFCCENACCTTSVQYKFTEESR